MILMRRLVHYILLVNRNLGSQSTDVEIHPLLHLMLYYVGNCCIFLLDKIFQLSSSSFENIFETDIIYKTIYF